MNNPPAVSANNTKASSVVAPAPTSRSKRILIVDDEPQFIEMMQLQLVGCGYRVDSATDGVEGIKKIMASDYAVVLCDMVMPKLAGDKFYQAVERVKPDLCKRFIFVTGQRGDPKMDAFIRKIRGLVLWKPFLFHVLLEAIQAIEKKSA